MQTLVVMLAVSTSRSVACMFLLVAVVVLFCRESCYEMRAAHMSGRDEQCYTRLAARQRLLTAVCDCHVQAVARVSYRYTASLHVGCLPATASSRNG